MRSGVGDQRNSLISAKFDETAGFGEGTPCEEIRYNDQPHDVAKGHRIFRLESSSPSPCAGSDDPTVALFPRACAVNSRWAS